MKNFSMKIFGKERICGKNLDLNLMSQNMIGLDNSILVNTQIQILYILNMVISSDVGRQKLWQVFQNEMIRSNGY